jgi:DNA-binding transcriptional LysR family regulator
MATIVNHFVMRDPGVTVLVFYADRVTHLLEDGIDVALRIGYTGYVPVFAVVLGHVQR